MPTPLEYRLLHLAVRQAGLEEEHYRMILRNVAGVESSKELTQVDLENVMAVLEDSGFRHVGKPEDYWRSKVAMRGSICGERMVKKIEELAAGQKYDLAGLCRRVSEDRVARVDKLRPREAYRLIEALKAIVQRAAGEQTSRVGVKRGHGCPRGLAYKGLCHGEISTQDRTVAHPGALGGVPRNTPGSAGDGQRRPGLAPRAGLSGKPQRLLPIPREAAGWELAGGGIERAGSGGGAAAGDGLCGALGCRAAGAAGGVG